MRSWTGIPVMIATSRTKSSPSAPSSFLAALVPGKDASL